MNTYKKYLRIFCLLISANTFANITSDYTNIKGLFKFPSAISEIKLKYVVDGNMETYSTSSVSNQGFGFILFLDKPGFYYLDYGQMNITARDQLIRFYLEPGQDISIDIYKNDYKLDGERLGYNPIVKEANKIHDEFASFNILSENMKSLEQFSSFLENRGVSLVQDFKKSIKTKDETFNNLLKLAVTADFEIEVMSFFQLPRTGGIIDREDRPETYKKLMPSKMKFTNNDILKLGNGLSWMSTYFFDREYSHDSLRGKNKEMFDLILKQVATDQLKEVYLIDRIGKSKLNESEDYKKLVEPLYQYFTSEKSKQFLVEYENKFYNTNGQPGLDFKYENQNGQLISFSDYRGKYIYVDVWATWCKPCVAEIPYLKELENKYKGEDIVFMSVSIDKWSDKNKWKDFVNKESLGGIQLIGNDGRKSSIALNYNINSIPRFLLFDKDGIIISNNASRPSDPQLKDQLDNLLNQK